MASQFDESDFIDSDFQSSQGTYSAAPTAGAAGVTFRPPSQQQLDSRVGDAQQKLAALKRAQEELERERAALEEARRRRLEFQTGREEMLQSLTRGVTLLEQAEFGARRDVEQMGKTLIGLRTALNEVQAIQEEGWTSDSWNVELTRALATIENARMEWNGARLKCAILNGQSGEPVGQEASRPALPPWHGCTFWELCRVGAALTWPIAAVGLIGLILFLVCRTR